MNEHHRRALDSRWADVLADTDATVEEYRERGWDALSVRPGDVNPIEGDARLDVLIPGSAFEDVSERMAEVEIDAFRVYAAAEAGVTFRLVVGEDETSEFACCVPTFLFDEDAGPMRMAADTHGSLTIRLRPLDDRDVVELQLMEPEVFFEARAPE
ncbi:DUF7529 family protein [Halorubrum vacuolatum]|uniref:Uncharacterized protein n=1 Tax=Halorubrum vacuolatum TaxID=63740 RepID=A0A238XMC9_HALVU|nr:hypothetical protein [Halorubrum vacuolatum]SNR59504.1 hypothetical protein SAMN06264855_11937 [Halorubrum vacuolatum]